MIIKAALRQKLFYVCCRTFLLRFRIFRSYFLQTMGSKSSLKVYVKVLCQKLFSSVLTRMRATNFFLKFGVTGVKIPHCESVKLYWCSYVHKWCEKFLLETAEDMIIYDIYYTKITFGPETYFFGREYSNYICAFAFQIQFLFDFSCQAKTKGTFCTVLPVFLSKLPFLKSCHFEPHRERSIGAPLERLQLGL